METMINEIKGLQISDATARLVACRRMADKVYDNILHALCEAYGEYIGEEMMQDKCLDIFNQVDDVIRDLIAETVTSEAEQIEMEDF